MLLRSSSSRPLLCLSLIPFLATLANANPDNSAPETLTTDQLIKRANAFLSKGKANEALNLYDLALDRNPNDYLTRYKKATTHMSMGQYNHASESFQMVLSLSDYDKARIQLAKIYLRQGQYDIGLEQVNLCIKNQKTLTPDLEAIQIKSDLIESQTLFNTAIEKANAKKWDVCISEANAAIQFSPQSVELRQLRSDCHLAQGHIEEAAGDLTRVAQLSPNNALVPLRLAVLSAIFLAQPIAISIAPIKKCLHSDPESKPCKKAFRLYKSVDKELTKTRNFMDSKGYRSAIKILNPKGNEADGLIQTVKKIIIESQVVDTKSGLTEPIMSPSIPNLIGHSQLLTTLLGYACKAYISLNEKGLSVPFCSEVYERDSENIDGIVGKGEQELSDENFEEAVRLLTKAYQQTGRSNQDILARLRKAQTALKVSKQKDYYKVLGVPRDVDNKTLKKAFRKASLKAHPDKGGSQEKMAALNEAYGVLSNPELRQRYDNGDDPNDQSQQGHPFQQGSQVFQQFFQQGGGFPFGDGASFTFHFG